MYPVDHVPDADASADGPASGHGDGRTARWAEHRDHRRTALVEAGAIAIDKYGPEANAGQIANVAGVSRTVLYRYFADKDDLNRAIAAHIVENALRTLNPLLLVVPGATPNSVIRGTISSVVEFLDAHTNQYMFLRQQRNIAGNSIEAIESTLASQVANLLRVFIAYFGLADDHAEPAAHAVVGMVEATAAWWLAHRTLPRDKLIDFISTSIWYLLAGQLKALGRELDPNEPLPVGMGS